MFSIKLYEDELTDLCRRLRVRRLDLAGSAARDDMHPDSDVDVLVAFIGADHLFDRYFSLKESLEALFKRPVDVIMDDAVSNPIVRENLDRDRRSVYAA